MKTNQLLKTLEKIFDLTVNDYAFNGLQVQGTNIVKKIALGVSASLETIEEAVRKKADALIVHHGIFWYKNPVFKIDGVLAKKLNLLIKNEINLIAIHLPLDGHLKYGHAALLAKKLGMKNITSFGEYKGTNLGVQGSISKISASILAKRIEKILGHQVILTSDNAVCKLGIITGSASFCYKLGADLSLNAVITGELTEKDWHNAREHNISLLAAGHTASEKLGMIKLKELLGKDSFFIDSDNPV